MTRTVEYCLGNVDSDTRQRLRELCSEECEDLSSKDSDFKDVIEKRCLQRGGDCYRGPLLVIDGTAETGATHAEILLALETHTGEVR